MMGTGINGIIILGLFVIILVMIMIIRSFSIDSMLDSPINLNLILLIKFIIKLFNVHNSLEKLIILEFLYSIHSVCNILIFTIKKRWKAFSEFIQLTKIFVL